MKTLRAILFSIFLLPLVVAANATTEQINGLTATTSLGSGDLIQTQQLISGTYHDRKITFLDFVASMSLPGSQLTGAYTASGMTLSTGNRLLGRVSGAGTAQEINWDGSLALTAGTLGVVQSALTPVFANLTGIPTTLAGYGISDTSANLATAITDETGSGSLVFAHSPTLVTPILGAATATSINGLTITSGTGTLTIAAGKTLTASNTLTLAGTDGSALNIGAGGTLGSNAFTSTAFVPQTVTVNGHALSGNIAVTASDVGAVTTTGNQTISGTKNFTGLFEINGRAINSISIFFPESYGTIAGDGSSDDTAAVQAAINAAEAIPGAIALLDGKIYGVTDTLIVDSDMALHGVSMAPVLGGFGSGGAGISANVNMSFVAPYFTGSVIMMKTAAKDIIKVTAVGASVKFDDFAVRFADSIKFVNTGHGINCAPPPYTNATFGTTLQDNGIAYSTWNNIGAYGMDGNHYGIWQTNSFYSVLTNIYTAGGGGICFEDNGFSNYGNAKVTGCWLWLCVGGSGHGVYFKNTGSGIAGSGVENIATLDLVQALPLTLPTGQGGFVGTETGSATSGSNVVSVSTVAGLFIGQGVSSTHIPFGDGAFISSINFTANTFTISKVTLGGVGTKNVAVNENATGTASETLTFTISAPRKSQYLFLTDPECWLIHDLNCSWESTSGLSGGKFYGFNNKAAFSTPGDVNGFPSNFTPDFNNFSPLYLRGKFSFGNEGFESAGLHQIQFLDYPANPFVDGSSFSIGMGTDSHSLIQHVYSGDGAATFQFGGLPSGNYTSIADQLAAFIPWAKITPTGIFAEKAGGGFGTAEGANCKQGTATLAAGTVTVSNTSVTSSSRIIVTCQSLGTVTTPQALAITARSAGTSFTVTSESSMDTSTFAYEIFEPAP